MYKIILREDFKTMFINRGRGTDFTPQALGMLYDYYTDMEEDLECAIQVDVVAICCEWSEEPLSQVLENYTLESLEDLQQETLAMMVDDTTTLYMGF